MPTKKVTAEETGEYALIKDGEVESVGAEPDGFELPDGSTVTTPVGVPTDPKVLAEAGYLPVVEAPLVVPEGQEVESYDYIVTKKHVERVPVFHDYVEPEPNPPSPQVQHLIDRLSEMEQRVAEVDSFSGRLDDLGARIDTLVENMQGTEAVSFGTAIEEMQRDIRYLKGTP
jgi:hypothetical protein